MPRTFYAAHYPSGINAVSARTGAAWRELRTFDSRAERDAYVAGAPADRGDGARRALRRSAMTRAEIERARLTAD